MRTVRLHCNATLSKRERHTQTKGQRSLKEDGGGKTEVYDLQGRRMDDGSRFITHGSDPRITIVNGRKVVVK